MSRQEISTRTIVARSNIAAWVIKTAGQNVTDHNFKNGDPIASEGKPPYDNDMETRVAKLEADMIAIKIDLAVIKANGATKADLAEAKTTIILWVVSAFFLTQLLPALLKGFGL